MIAASFTSARVSARLRCDEMSMPISRMTATASDEAQPPPQPATPADSATQPFPASLWFSQPSAIGLRQVFPVHTTSTFFNRLPVVSILDSDS